MTVSSSDDSTPITKKGLERLEKELHQLKSEERPRIVEAIQRARELGDLSENADYSAAKEKQSMIEGKIQYLESLISSCYEYKIEYSSSDSEPNVTVKFGATVEMENLDTSERVTYTIVSEYESNIKKGLISLNSPIAVSAIGNSVGDMIEVKASTIKQYKIIKIEYKDIEI